MNDITELKNIELAEYLGLEGSNEELFLDGIEVSPQKLSEILEDINSLDYNSIRGTMDYNIGGEVIGKVSYDSSYFIYDKYDKTIFVGKAMIDISKAKSIKLYTSPNNWIDIIFDYGDSFITFVVVP